MKKLNFLLMTILTMVLFMVSCGEDSDTAEKDLCENIICQNEGVCNEGLCECQLGFEGDNCEVINYCVGDPCLNGGTCTMNTDNYTCECAQGYKGSNCQFDTTAFITVWRTSIGSEAVSEDNQIRIPTNPDLIYNYNVDCNTDGIFEAENQTGDYTCTYLEEGEYTVSITGTFPHLYFVLGYDDDWKIQADNKKIMSVEQWGTQKWETMEKAFNICSNLVINAIDTPDLSNVSSMKGMFMGVDFYSSSFGNISINDNQSVKNWDTSNVTDMSLMFAWSESNLDISSWDVSNVINMKEMFSHAVKFNQDISSWDVSSVTDMNFMFSEAESFNQDLSSWNVNNVTGCFDFSGFASSWILPKPNFTSCNP